MRLLPLLLAAAFVLPACKPRKPVPPVEAPGPPTAILDDPAPPAPDSAAVINQLIDRYQNGQLTRCTVAGGIIYVGARNAPDAGAELFDAYGKKIGACYYSSNQLHPYCDSLYTCQDLYRVHPNIWAQPGIPRPR